MAGAKARITAKLQQSPDVDYVVTLGAPFAPTALDAVDGAGSKAKVGTFDLTPRVADLIGDGKLQWAVDQQPFVEGYEAVDLIWLNKTNGDLVGGGQAGADGPDLRRQEQHRRGRQIRQGGDTVKAAPT